MPEIPEFDFESILRTLADYEVDFIVVGGVAAVIDGAPINTFDLDIVHSRAPANVDRLLAALESLDAWYRTHAATRLRPNQSHLSSSGHNLLMTRYGPLDVLGRIGQSRAYEDLSPLTDQVQVDEGLRVRVLNLETLITIKEEVAGEKDLAVLPIMRRTLEEKRRR